MGSGWFRLSKCLEIYLDLNKNLEWVKRKMFSVFTIPFKIRQQFATGKYFKSKNTRTGVSVSNTAITQLTFTCSESTTETLKKV